MVLVHFMGSTASTEKSEYTEAIARVREWEGLLLALIHWQGKEPSVSDQLRELYELNNLGTLTDSEYRTQKERLLSKQFGKAPAPQSKQPSLREVQGDS